MSKVITATFMFLLLSGCASTVSTMTTTYHHTPEHDNRGTIIVLPINNGQRNLIEFEFVKNYLSTKLVQAGYSKAKSRSDAEYIATINYTIDSGRTINSSIPIYGQTGGGTSFTKGTVSSGGSFGTYNETTYVAPTYGVVGSTIISTTNFTKTITVRIFRNDSNNGRVYGILGVSVGQCSNLIAVIEPMLDGMFQNFPGENGRMKNVNVEWDGDC